MATRTESQPGIVSKHTVKGVMVRGNSDFLVAFPKEQRAVLKNESVLTVLGN